MSDQVLENESLSEVVDEILNTSGIYPVGDRLLVRIEKVDKVSEGGIIMPDETHELEQKTTSKGTIVAIGSTAWVDIYNGDPWAKEGDTVIFAKYGGGAPFVGDDGNHYRLMNDEDILALKMGEK